MGISLRCRHTENHRVAFSHGLHKHRRAGLYGRGGLYGLRVDARAVGVEHVVGSVQICLAGERVAHQVPALPVVSCVVHQRKFAIAAVGRAEEH